MQNPNGWSASDTGEPPPSTERDGRILNLLSEAIAIMKQESFQAVGGLKGNRFQFGSRIAELTPLQARVMSVVWPPRGEPVDVVDVIDRAWDGRQVSDGTISSTVSRLNARLSEYGVPVEISYRSCCLHVVVYGEA